MKYKVILTTPFKRDLKKLKKRGKKIEKLNDVVDMLAMEMVLDPKYRDHQLTNSKRFFACRECHIEPDWLLVYKKSNQEVILLLVETGTHSDLFNK